MNMFDPKFSSSMRINQYTIGNISSCLHLIFTNKLVTVFIVFSLIFIIQSCEENVILKIEPHKAIYEIEFKHNIENFKGIGQSKISICGNMDRGFMTTELMEVELKSKLSESAKWITKRVDFESIDDGLYKFINESRSKDKYQKNSGIAVRKNSEFTITFDNPNSYNDYSIQESPLFPVEHVLKTIMNAKLGIAKNTDLLYNGNGKVIHKIESNIGPTEVYNFDERENEFDGSELLMGKKYWTVIYKTDNFENESSNVSTNKLQLHENGIMRNFHITSTEVSMRGKLIELELISKVNCNLKGVISN